MEETPEALWIAWRGGDAAAFETLYREIRPGLYTLCKALARRGPVCADDLFQETFRRAVAFAGSYRSGHPLRPWLSAIARNAFLDLMREAGRRPRLVPLDADPASSPPADILDALAVLPAEQAEAIALRHLQGLTVAEAAAAMEVSPATLKRRIAEGFAALAKMEKG